MILRSLRFFSLSSVTSISFGIVDPPGFDDMFRPARGRTCRYDRTSSPYIRKGEAECCPLSLLTLHPYCAAVEFHVTFADGQSQTGAAVVSRCGAVDLLKRPEQPPLIFR